MRMLNAFEEGFNAGFEKIIIIGSDMFQLSQTDMEEAFSRLDDHDVVLGPAEDGGYYLLGMTALKKEVNETVVSENFKIWLLQDYTAARVKH